MTQGELLIEYFGLTIRSLMQDASESPHQRAAEREEESAERLARCAARKADQWRRASAAGLLSTGGSHG